MTTHPDLYPPRDRATNVQLIKELRAAVGQEAFEAADDNVAKNLHPSLLAELDWMEMTMPSDQRADGERLADGLFHFHLPAIMLQRVVEFDLPDEDLRWEVSANAGFYEKLVRDEARPLDVFGESLSGRIRACVDGIEPDVDGVIARMCDQEKPRIHQDFSGVEDPDWLLLLIDAEIRNAVVKALDHVTSRVQAKQFLRHIGGEFPRLGLASIDSDEDVQTLVELLGSLEEAARKSLVHRLASVCRVLREMFDGADSSTLSAFCGEQIRAEAPAMFYSPHRNQVIYNYPRAGQFTEEEAREAHRPVITAIRERYIDRIDGEEEAAFHAAGEEITYSTTDFLVAIQMGTTVKEEHVYNVVRFADGSGAISDVTKGVLIGLTRNEMREHREAARAVDLDAGLQDEGIGGGPAVKEAMEAFGAGEYERSRDILEELYKKHPGDDVVRKNLAVAYVTLGDKDAARRVLAGGAP